MSLHSTQRTQTGIGQYNITHSPTAAAAAAPRRAGAQNESRVKFLAKTCWHLWHFWQISLSRNSLHFVFFLPSFLFFSFIFSTRRVALALTSTLPFPTSPCPSPRYLSRTDTKHQLVWVKLYFLSLFLIYFLTNNTNNRKSKMTVRRLWGVSTSTLCLSTYFSQFLFKLVMRLSLR